MRSIFILLSLIASLYGQFVPNQYIVELKEESQERPAERQTRARARQKRVEGALGARGFKVTGRTENVANALMVEAPDDGSDARSLVGQLADVSRVHKVRLFHKTLDRAAQVHAVTAAWERLGIASAGKGIKIGILDSGIEITHKGFADAGYDALTGFPKAGTERDLAYTNKKVIVARSYSSLFARSDPDTSVLDRRGHGTAVAMCAAGTQHESPLGTIAGMAPAAYIGVYKIFGTPGFNDSTTDAAILKAIDDAVADGMDVINMSFGSILASRPENDIIVKALER
ncbi:MAG: S8 family serine peptidase, partial [Acidobacteria bacterium]|nr:S8 family serine peptidase [Acidobacteriota bacterium]